MSLLSLLAWSVALFYAALICPLLVYALMCACRGAVAGKPSPATTAAPSASASASSTLSPRRIRVQQATMSGTRKQTETRSDDATYSDEDVGACSLDNDAADATLNGDRYVRVQASSSSASRAKINRIRNATLKLAQSIETATDAALSDVVAVAESKQLRPVIMRLDSREAAFSPAEAEESAVADQRPPNDYTNHTSSASSLAHLSSDSEGDDDTANLRALETYFTSSSRPHSIASLARDDESGDDSSSEEEEEENETVESKSVLSRPSSGLHATRIAVAPSAPPTPDLHHRSGSHSNLEPTHSFDLGAAAAPLAGPSAASAFSASSSLLHSSATLPPLPHSMLAQRILTEMSNATAEDDAAPARDVLHQPQATRLAKPVLIAHLHHRQQQPLPPFLPPAAIAVQ